MSVSLLMTLMILGWPCEKWRRGHQEENTSEGKT